MSKYKYLLSDGCPDTVVIEHAESGVLVCAQYSSVAEAIFHESAKDYAKDFIANFKMTDDHIRALQKLEIEEKKWEFYRQMYAQFTLERQLHARFSECSSSMLLYAAINGCEWPMRQGLIKRIEDE